MKRHLVESFSMEDAFKALNESKGKEISEDKLSYKGFEDLFDQVYCSLTHGEDRGAPRRILGDLGRVETKYADYDVSVDYSMPNATRIAVVAPDEAIGNAIAVAEIYGLDYSVQSFDKGISKVFIVVPDDEPVNKSVLHYIDAENRLQDISAFYRDTNGKTVSSYSRRNELITASAEVEDENKEEIVEDVSSSMPATPLSISDIHSFVDNLPEATPSRPPQAFKLGYIRELKAEIPAKFKGGRGSDGQPFVRIFKATEYSRLYTKAAYENLGSTKAYRKETGKEAGHERTGFQHSSDAETGTILNAIGAYPNGDLALQTYPMSDNKIKVAYFISIDDSDLAPATKEDIAMYLTPASAAKLLNTREVDAEAPRSADNINRFKLSGIYMLGNLGHSII